MKEQKQEQLEAQKPKQEKLDKIQQNGHCGEHLKRQRPELKQKLSSMIKDFSESTSAHGPPKIVGHRYVAGKVFWVILFLTGICVFGYFSYELIIQYRKYETTTDVQMKFDAIDFPAVTFCNLNPFQTDKIDGVIQEYILYLSSQMHRVDENTGYNNETTTQSFQTTEAPEPFFTGEVSSLLSDASEKKVEAIERLRKLYYEPELSAEELSNWRKYQDNALFELASLNFLALIPDIDEEALKSAAYKLTEMMQGCTFNSRFCNPRDFYQFYDRKYGNCFTFNSGLNNSYAKARVAGRQHGLSMTLFVNQKQYIPGLGNQAGIRVLVHRQGELPNMDKGFNVPPGLRSSVALSYSEVNRLQGEHYSNCTNEEDYTPENPDFPIPGLYTLQGCYDMCVQQLIYQSCGCSSGMLTQVPGYRVCTSDDEGLCALRVQYDIVYGVNCSCPLPCKELEYSTSLSFSDWPAAKYEATWTPYIKERVPTLQNKSDIKNEFVSIEVYFESLKYTVFTERASMKFEDLVGSIGGHLGLWIGMSVISFLEIFELIAGLFSVCGKFVYKRRKSKTKNKDLEQS